MRLREIAITTLTTVLCVTVAISAAFQSQDNRIVPGGDKQIQIVVEQLPQLNGIIPAEMRCGIAHLTASGALGNFSCVLINNSDKNILAANLTYSITFEFDGKESTDTRMHTIETLIHPDFFEISRMIRPRGQSIIEPPGPTSYTNSIIKSMEIKVDYVEFEDKTTLGSNEKAAQLIANIRRGAAKYKHWLVKKYLEGDRSVENIMPFLDKDGPLPNEITFDDANQERGAKAYRKRFQDDHNTHGAERVRKYLNK